MSSRIRSIQRWTVSGAAIFIFVPLLAIQVPAPPKFEAATIKQEVGESRIFGCHGTDSATSSPSVPLGRCLGVANLNWLISEAYDIPGVAQPEWIVGGPSWRDLDRYTVDAKAESPTTRQQLDQMLQTLLHDRFKLAFHRQLRPIPGFILVVGKGGSKLTPATGQESHPGLNKKMKRAADLSGMQTSFSAENVPLSDLAVALSSSLGRPVVDKTGLKGNYNFTIPFFPRPENNDPSDASIFTVIQSLGLRLESQRVPVDVFVIDHVEKPSLE